MEGETSISVIVRTVGGGRLGEALESLARQSRRDFEVVLVDMSEGGSAAALARMGARLPRLRRLAPPRRLSRPAALNAGVAAAAAPRIAILDDDNLYDPEHLERLVGGLDAAGADYVYTGVRHATFDPDGRPVACREVAIPFQLDRVILGNFIYATGSAYRKAVWRRLGGYDERFEVFEDWDFIIRVAQAGRLVHLPLVSGESRKFTGVDGVSNFDLEIRLARRCLAGIYWKHRRLYRGALYRELQLVAAEHCRRRRPPRTGLLARSVAGWRLELGCDLLAWWGANLGRARGEHGARGARGARGDRGLADEATTA
jgi:glycosyltransferase involved in cell wall biosynthesis